MHRVASIIVSMIFVVFFDVVAYDSSPRPLLVFRPSRALAPVRHTYAGLPISFATRARQRASSSKRATINSFVWGGVSRWRATDY